MLTAAERRTTFSPTPPTTPRLQLRRASHRRTHLDGGWWPRSRDLVAELPGLVLAIDDLHGKVTRLVLPAEGWTSRPRRLGVDGRIIRIGYFHSQPVTLLTATCGNAGDRIDLLLIAPETPPELAHDALTLVSTTGNAVRSPHILATVTALRRVRTDEADETTWDNDGGQ